MPYKRMYQSMCCGRLESSGLDRRSTHVGTTVKPGRERWRENEREKSGEKDNNRKQKVDVKETESRWQRK